MSEDIINVYGMSINRVTIYIFGVLTHTGSMIQTQFLWRKRLSYYSIRTVLWYPSPKGKSPEKLRKSTTEMTKLDIKGATDRLASMRGVDIVGANNNLQEGKNLLTLAPGMLFVTIFESFDLSKNLLWAWGAGLLSGLLIVTLRRFPLNVATLEPAFKVSVFFSKEPNVYFTNGLTVHAGYNSVKLILIWTS